MKVRVCGSALRPLGAVLASALLAACSSGTSGSSPSTAPQPSRTPDAASLVHTYTAMLSTDLSPLQPVDAACRGGTAACRTALDQAAVVAAKVGDDLQHATAEPDGIRKPVEDIRTAARFVLSVDQAFDAGTMSMSDAVNAYTSEFNALEQALQQLEAAH